MAEAPNTARAIVREIVSGRTTATAVLDGHLARITSLDPELGAFVEVFEDEARTRARDLDASLAAGGSPGPLFGVPVAIKDNLVRRDQLTTCASKILDGFVSPYTATAVQRLLDAGAVIVGRTNMDEFGMGSSTEYSRYGPTRNPFDRSRSPGGSSGGSAAAVAAGMVPLALGSDTGGSVRQPAALCGISGLKPTYGRVSRFGLVAFASSLDTVAPFARDAADLHLLLHVIAGHDARDGTSIDAVAPDPELSPTDLGGLRVGVAAEYFGEGLDAEIEAQTRKALATLAEHGATLVDVSMPHTRYAIPTYYLIATAEASSNLARYDGVRYGLRKFDGERDLHDMYTSTRYHGFGDEVKRRVLLGSYCLCQGYVEEWYVKAQQVRTLIRRDFDVAFDDVDVLAAPTSPLPAFAIGEKTDDPLAMYMNDILTTPANLAGVPALSIPCGFTEGGLPVGLQLTGRPLAEPQLLSIAGAFQAVTDHHKRTPTL